MESECAKLTCQNAGADGRVLSSPAETSGTEGEEEEGEPERCRLQLNESWNVS